MPSASSTDDKNVKSLPQKNIEANNIGSAERKRKRSRSSSRHSD